MQAAVVTAAAVNALTINAVTITGGNISGTTITGVTIRSIATQTKVTLGEGGCAINIYEGANVNPGQITHVLSGMLGLSSRDNGYGVAAIFIAPNTASSYGDITLSGDCIVVGAFEAYGAGRIDGNLRIDGNVQPYGKVNPQTDFPGVGTGWTSDDGIWIQDNNPEHARAPLEDDLQLLDPRALALVLDAAPHRPSVHLRLRSLHMADANTVIANLGQQVAQLTVDKAILEAEVAEARAGSPTAEAGSVAGVVELADGRGD